MVWHGFRHLKTHQKNKLILAISADLETRLDSLACQIRSPCDPLTLVLGNCGSSCVVFDICNSKKKKKKKKKIVQNLTILTEFENRLDLPSSKLPPFDDQIIHLGPVICFFFWNWEWFGMVLDIFNLK
ncbi:unnamed protein product, partial [Meganyctiphanes norvegica]